MNAVDWASQLGLLASSTPFVTGRPSTLLCASNAFSDGSVGVALAGPERPRLHNIVRGYREISQVRTVMQYVLRLLSISNGSPWLGSSKGNLIHLVDDTKPTRALLTDIHTHGIPDANAKFDGFFVAALADDGTYEVGMHPDDQETS